MCEKQKFLICKHCGNLIGMIKDAGVKVICCGEPMSELIPNKVEASAEKHLPVITVDGDTVTVAIGSAAHPMLEEHHIEWVYIQTEHGGQRKCLAVGSDPVVTFQLADDTLVAAFAYCNLHGLWETIL